MASILILDDDSTRVERFRRVIESMPQTHEVKVWANANAMASELDRHLADAGLISLDHDLYPPKGSTDDWGDGLQVAKYLASNPAVCPVIVRSSNSDRARQMIGELELAMWVVKQVAPFGDDWIEGHWRRTAMRLLHPDVRQ